MAERGRNGRVDCWTKCCAKRPIALRRRADQVRTSESNARLSSKTGHIEMRVAHQLVVGPSQAPYQDQLHLVLDKSQQKQTHGVVRDISPDSRLFFDDDGIVLAFVVAGVRDA